MIQCFSVQRKKCLVAHNKEVLSYCYGLQNIILRPPSHNSILTLFIYLWHTHARARSIYLAYNLIYIINTTALIFRGRVVNIENDIMHWCRQLPVLWKFKFVQNNCNLLYQMFSRDASTTRSVQLWSSFAWFVYVSVWVCDTVSTASTNMVVFLSCNRYIFIILVVVKVICSNPEPERWRKVHWRRHVLRRITLFQQDFVWKLSKHKTWQEIPEQT